MVGNEAFPGSEDLNAVVISFRQGAWCLVSGQSLPPATGEALAAADI